MAAAWRIRGRRDKHPIPPKTIYRSGADTEKDFCFGTRRNVLHPFDGVWKIARRRMVLDQAVLTAKNLSIFF
jgi:3-phenylpropionate/cinnamic acid dioxygenase small subunit